MRPILVNIPMKVVIAVALLLAAGTFVLNLLRRRKNPSEGWSSTPLLLLVGAGIIYRFVDKPAVPIYAYGVMLGTSLIVGWFLAMRFAKQDGVSPADAGTIYMWTAVWSIIGARVLWFITDPPPNGSIFDLFKIWQGGLVAYGGMIGGFLASWYGCRKRKIPLLRWADVAAPPVVLGTAITRIGCFLFGCDYGARSDMPWAIRFPGPNPLAPHGSPAWQHHVADFGMARTEAWSMPVHPTQLYESASGLFLFALLMLLRRYRKFSGQVFLGWVLGYGVLRPLIETVRDDSDRGVYSLGFVSLSTSQIIGIVSVILGLILLVHLVRQYRRNPEGSRLWEQPMLSPAAAAAGAGGGGGSGGGGGGGRASANSKRKKRR